MDYLIKNMTLCLLILAGIFFSIDFLIHVMKQKKLDRQKMKYRILEYKNGSFGIEIKIKNKWFSGWRYLNGSLNTLEGVMKYIEDDKKERQKIKEREAGYKIKQIIKVDDEN